MNQFNLANISTELGQLERAAQQYEEVRAVSQELENRDGQLYASLNLAIVYGRLNQLEASKTNYDRVAELLEENDQALIRRRLYEGYTSYYLKVGDTLRSEDYQLRFEALVDEQLGTERQNRFLALQSDYEIRVKEQELALSQLEAERLAIRNQLYTVIGVALFVALFAVYILQRRRIERLRSLYERNLEIVRSGADMTGSVLVEHLLQGNSSNPISKEDIDTDVTSTVMVESVEYLPVEIAESSEKDQSNAIKEKASKLELYKMILQALSDEELYRNQNLSLEDLSHKFGSNRRYISESINQIGKTTFYELVNTYRAKAARRKMIESDNRSLTLKTVMKQSGFSNMATFHKYFKTLTGMTPGEFSRISK
jgi:YesN/AraC family two-component response regulator